MFVPGKRFKPSLTSTLAYFENYGQKSFITLGPGANVIKLFTTVDYNWTK